MYGPNETASIFATYPSEYMTLSRSFLDQVRVMICVTFNQYFNSCSFIELLHLYFSLGSGHRHADVVHPVFG